MSFMSELDIAKQDGEKLTLMRRYNGRLVWVCTACGRSARKLRFVRHSANCPNKGK